MEYLQAIIRGNRVLVQDKSYVQARNCRYSDNVFPAMDRHQCVLKIWYTLLLLSKVREWF
jgi:hypothetical protein